MLSMTFTPTDTQNYETVTQMVPINVRWATPTFSVSNPGGTFTGTPFNATASVAGVVSGVDDSPAASLEGVTATLNYYVGSDTTGTKLSSAPTTAGIYTVVASFPGSDNYTSADSDPLTFTIAKSPPTITWNNPDDITSGTALGSLQLNATSNVPGTFVYTPAPGTILGVGNNQMLSVTFTPTDTANYATVTQVVYVDVLSRPVVTTLSQSTGVSGGAISYTIDITGTGFTDATHVYFGAVDAPWYVVNSDTSITVYVPGHSHGTVDVTVANSNGTSAISSADKFTFINSAPTGADNALTVIDGQDLFIALTDFGFSDENEIAADNFVGVYITALPDSGTLYWYNGSSWVAVTANQFISATTLSSYYLKFTPAGPATTNFTFQVKDDGGTDDGGVDVDPIARTMTINVYGM